MPYIILLAGLPAVGKTTFSRFISKELCIPAISKDYIKEILFDSLGFQSRAEKVRLGDASRDVMYGMAEEFMRLELPVILENNFDRNSKAHLEDLISQYGYDCITVLFEGETEAIYRRFIARNHSSLRHPGHITNQCYPLKDNMEPVSDMTLEQFRDIAAHSGIADFCIGKELIRVDATDIEAVDYKGILGRIKETLASL